MANIYNFGLAGVASGVQFGKGGTQLLSNSGTFSAVASDGTTLVQFQIANASTSQHAVTLGALQSAATLLNANTATLTSEVRGVETGAGLASSTGNYTAPGNSNYLGTATTLKSADSLLDAAIKAVQDEVDTAETAIGLGTNGTLGAFTGTQYLSNAGTVVAALKALDAAVNSDSDAVTVEMNRAKDAEANIAANVAGEITRATTAEDGLNANVISNVATLNSTIDTLNANVVSNVATLVTAIGTVQGNVASETTRASGVETTLTTNLASEVTRATDAEGTLTTNLGNEVTRAQGVEANLSAAVITEAGRANTAEGVLRAAISAEALRANSAETQLNSNIAGEVSRATTAEGSLRTDLTAETTRAEAAELIMHNAITDIQSSYINKNGSVAFTADASMGGFKLTDMADGAANGDAVNFKQLNDAINGLGSAFSYVGTVSTAGDIQANAASIASLTGPSGATLAKGDYYKVNAAGWLTDGSNPAFFVQAHDGIVYNGTSWDVIAHVDSVVLGDPGTITVSGSVDTGFTVHVANVFQDRVSTLESNAVQQNDAISNEVTRATTAEGTLTTALGDEVSRANTAETTLTSNLNAEISRAEGAETDLGTRITGETSRASNAETAIRAAIAGNVANAVAGNQVVLSNVATVKTSVGLDVLGNYVAPTGTSYLNNTTSVMNALGALDSAVHTGSDAVATERTRAMTAEGSIAGNVAANFSTLNASIDLVQANVTTNVQNAIAGNSAMGNAVNAAVFSLTGKISTVNANVISNVASIYTELDAVEAAVGLGLDGTFVPFTTTHYMNAATSVVASLIALDDQADATATALANLSQNSINSASKLSSVLVDDTLGVVTKLDVGGVATQVAATVAGTATNTSLITDFTTADVVRLTANGTSDNVDIRLEPQGTGQVFIGAAGVAGIMQGEAGQSLEISGGTNANLILSGGATSGIVQITDGHAKTVAEFSGVANTNSFFALINGVGSATLAATGSPTSVDLVLTPKGLGAISASSHKIINVASGTSGTDAANVGQVNSAIATAVTAAQAGAVYATSVAITEATGNVAIGAVVSGTVIRVRVLVGTAFNGASMIEIGTTSGGSDLMANNQIDGSLAGQAFVSETAASVSGTQLYANVTASGGSAGTATVVVEYLHA